MTAASNEGLAPPMVDFQENGDFVTRFIKGRHWSREDFLRPGNAERLGALVRSLHKIRLPSGFGMPWISRLERMVSAARALRCPLPENIDDLLQECSSIGSSRADTPMFLNHNDLWPNNFIDDGQKLWLVDFEFSGIGTGLHDLHTLLLSSGYAGEQKKKFIASCGFEPEWVEYGLSRYQGLVHLFEGTWASIQGILRGSSVVDYRSVARSHFESIARLG